MLRTAGSEDAKHVIDVLVEAFAQDRLWSWVFPERGQRSTLGPYIFGHYVDQALDSGTVTLAGDVGAAVWLAGNPTGGDTDGTDRSEALAVFGEAMSRLDMLTARMEERHPDHPHWYLPFIGVLPAGRGTGVGNALLRHGLQRCDSQGVGAYLEATSERSRALYERHEFVAQAHPIRLPDGPKIYPMWREHHDED